MAFVELKVGRIVFGIEVVEIFFFQAEDGIRDRDVTGVQTVLFRSPYFRS